MWLAVMVTMGVRSINAAAIAGQCRVCHYSPFRRPGSAIGNDRPTMWPLNDMQGHRVRAAGPKS